ncbi:alpha/beta fold hydrolase [Arthrobacter oryzae]|uniref:alpha/beta fold hydrolase n=1 Tax=Arthrobacter oryzae TaxID=409290 RepID=UPI0027838BA2|nr:alpha/beta fold hydrolase [Arthrobacter oryzae]MDQ0079263.1 pimeloyl-ACP methyl ester carboxylesterase [Arthrobacter oryzae]
MAALNMERTGTGKPLVLVHGLGSSIRNWDPVVPALSAEREVIAVDLPGFGASAPLAGEVTIGTLTDALQHFLRDTGLENADVVGSSMGARIVIELARRGHAGTVVALDPGGFWNDRQLAVFNASITASIALVRRLQPVLPFLTRHAAGRTALLSQFSVRPWKLDPEQVMTELRGFKTSPSVDDARKSLAHGPKQPGAPRGSLKGRLAIGWGRQDKVTPASQAAVAAELYPDATLHWFESCGHFPHWDQPEATVTFILEQTA